MNFLPRCLTPRFVRNAACLLTVALCAASARASTQPYTLEVWARVLFDTQGRLATASLEEWTFEPQQLNDKPIEGEYQLRMHLNTLDDKPQDFRQDKFQKILNSR